MGRLAASRARFLPFPLASLGVRVGMTWSTDLFQHGANDWKSHDRQADGKKMHQFRVQNLHFIL